MKKSKFDSSDEIDNYDIDPLKNINYSVEISEYLKRNLDFIKENGLDYKKVIIDLNATEKIDKDYVKEYLAENVVARNEGVKILNKLDQTYKHNLSQKLIKKYTKQFYDNGNDETIFRMKEQNEKQGCFVATLVYGGYDTKQVKLLRNYRDKTLSQTILGKYFIKLYYIYSPMLVKRIKNSERSKYFIKKLLNKFIKTIYLNN